MNYQNQPVGVERPTTHIKSFINESHSYNSDLRSAISRLDVLCSRLNAPNYPKNQLSKEPHQSDTKSSDGLIDDLGGLLREKEQLLQELRIAVAYLEQHI